MNLPAEFVLDASAVLALLKREPGAERVGGCLTRCVVSAVNLAEVGAKLSDYGMSDADVRYSLANLGVTVAPFDSGQALASAELRAATRTRGLSLADRACLALARSTGLTALTCDREWTRADLGVEIELVRP